jgi:uncharacterized repeat protein (TIGR02543 family)
MNKLKLCLAALITALALYSCGGEDAAMLTPGGPGYTPPDGKTDTGITITFKNGWEDAAEDELKDDDYTSFKINKALAPSTAKAVVDSAELTAYNEKLKIYEGLKKEWDDYQKALEAAQNDNKDPPPPRGNLPAEAVYPLAAIPYFPGNEYVSSQNTLIFGSAPEWDFHTLIGWQLEGGEEVSLNTPISENTLVTAVWAEAPAKPYHTVTFNKNDGTGAFEKRIATPETPPEGTSGEYEGGEIPAVEYKNFKIRESYKAGAGEVSQNPIIPVFTREHYKEEPVFWTDVKGATINVTNDKVYDGDTQLYRKWESKTFTVTFDLNREGLVGNIDDMPTSLSNVDEALSAEGGLAKAKQTLPPIETKLTTGSEEGKDLVTYEFRGWFKDAGGMNAVGANMPLYPANGAADVKLYAKWGAKGVYPVVFNYNGKNATDGSVQEFKVLADGIYQIEVWGAGGDGGIYESNSENNKGWLGGYGGYISGHIGLTKNTVLYIYVGGRGEDNLGSSKGDNLNTTPKKGGWNGGGDSSGAGLQDKGTSGGGGHGASDVRAVNGDWNNPESLASRIIVAGGGGARGGWYGHIGDYGNGGLGMADGGAAIDLGDASVKANGGGITENSGGIPEPSSGNISGVTAGGFGYGGKGGQATIGDKRGGGGGGGGGYGGYGGPTKKNGAPTGGGGGSSWAKTSGSGLYFIEDSIKPGDGVPGGGTNYGHGKVAITFIGTTVEE